jgi:hypothetical protein
MAGDRIMSAPDDLNYIPLEDINAGLYLVMLCGGAPPARSERSAKNRTKTAELERRGWRLLPIPLFRPAGVMWHDPKTGGGNPAYIDFSHSREWLVVPPKANGLRAQKVEGRICAIRLAWQLSNEGNPA